MKRLIIIGAGGHGKVVADIADKQGGYGSICFLDDGKRDDFIYPILGGVDAIEKFVKNSDFFVAIGNADTRKKITEKIRKAKGKIVSLFHPNAVIGANVVCGEGVVVMAGAVINSSSKIGNGVIINTCSSVDHDCIIGDYTHISVGAHIAGNVKIGDNTWISAGAIVINNLEIVNDCIIGAGAVVVKNINESGKYMGVPAKKKEATI